MYSLKDFEDWRFSKNFQENQLELFKELSGPKVLNFSKNIHGKKSRVFKIFQAIICGFQRIFRAKSCDFFEEFSGPTILDFFDI